MLEELQRRNYAKTTVQYYVQAVERFAKHFHRPPDQLNHHHLREDQAYLLRERNLEPPTVKLHVSALRFFFVKVLKRYTHRVAISNHRILNVADDTVTFQWKDYRHGSQPRTMTISAVEFLRRFFLHVLPRGFVRIRFCGFLAHRRRANDLPQCRSALAARPCQALATPPGETTTPTAAWPCPRCGGAMILLERLTAYQISGRAIAEGIFLDTS